MADRDRPQPQQQKPTSGGMTIEACVGCATDAIRADGSGASRLELCSAIECDGVTPSRGFVEQVLAKVQRDIVVLIRSRPGDFVFEAAEMNVMVRDVQLFAAMGVEAVAIGALRPDRNLDMEAMQRFAAAARAEAPTISITCHRAFDHVADFERALDELASLGVARILTSGGCATAAAGADTIARLQASTRIELVPAGGVRADNLGQIARRTGCRSVHGTFRQSQTSACVRLCPSELSRAVAQAAE